jgi:phosphoglycerol transferase MdoB-like AlkP superfamily enzyme
VCSIPKSKQNNLNIKQILYKDVKNVVNESIKWVKTNKNKNFFLFLHTYEPHMPLKDHRGFYDKYKKQYEKNGLDEQIRTLSDGNEGLFKWLLKTNIMYDCEIAYTDYHLKRFFNVLKQLDIYDKSLIILTSDHGEEFYEHGDTGHGKTLYNESINVPLIMKLPNQKEAVRENRWTAQGIDIFPTILELCGIRGHTAGIRGRSLLSAPTMDISRSHLFTDKGNLSAIQRDKKKLIYDYDNVEETLMFDLISDPYEQKNIYSAHDGDQSFSDQIEPLAIPEIQNDKCLDALDEEMQKRLKSLGYLQ